MQLLLYAAILRESGANINKIVIFNPIFGNIYEYDITNWKYNE